MRHLMVARRTSRAAPASRGAPAWSRPRGRSPAGRRALPGRSSGGPRAAPASPARQRGPASEAPGPRSATRQLTGRRAGRALRRPHRRASVVPPRRRRPPSATRHMIGRQADRALRRPHRRASVVPPPGRRPPIVTRHLIGRQADRALRRLHRRASVVPPRRRPASERDASTDRSPGGPRAAPASSARQRGSPRRRAAAERDASTARSPGGPRAAPASPARRRGPASEAPGPPSATRHLIGRQADRALRRPHRRASVVPPRGRSPAGRRASPGRSSGGPRAAPASSARQRGPALGGASPAMRHASPGQSPQADRALRRPHRRAGVVPPRGRHPAERHSSPGRPPGGLPHGASQVSAASLELLLRRPVLPPGPIRSFVSFTVTPARQMVCSPTNPLTCLQRLASSTTPSNTCPTPPPLPLLPFIYSSSLFLLLLLLLFTTL